MTRFVLSASPLTTDESKAITDYLLEFKSSGVGWWHWIHGTWLIVDPSGTLAVDSIRDRVHSIATSASVIVLQVESVTWSGFGPSSDKEGGQNMFRWLRDTWTRRSSR